MIETKIKNALYEASRIGSTDSERLKVIMDILNDEAGAMHEGYVSTVHTRQLNMNDNLECNFTKGEMPDANNVLPAILITYS
jgi:hypothetical protein